MIIVLVNNEDNGYNESRSMATDKPFLSFVVEEQLLAKLDDFRFKHRFPSRAAAIKWLLDWALTQKPKPEGQ
jgi:hypothetical protein